MKKVLRSLAPAVVVGISAVGSAHAAVDTTAITDAITAAGTAIGVVGAAYLAMTVGGRVFKWIKTAL